MDDCCEICDGPREAGPLPGPRICGHCLQLHAAALHRRGELSSRIAAALLQDAGKEKDSQWFDGMPWENAVELARGIELGQHEKAAELLPRVLRLPDPVAGLRQVAENPDLQEPVQLIERTSEYLAFLTLLRSEPSEADVCTFLAKRQHLLRAMLGCYHPGDTAICKKESQFGAQYRADFVFLYPRRSLPPVLDFVEFEPVTDPVFRKKGTPSSRLVQALKQIREWYDWTESNRSYFHEMLMQTFAGELDPVYLSTSLRRGALNIESFIVIGRRLSSDHDYRRLWSDKDHRLTIHSHDTLLEVAGHFDVDRLEAEAEWESRERIRETRKGAG